jgi:acyl-CoA synthetase (AMP-forming)/AMP-acid ligase II
VRHDVGTAARFDEAEVLQAIQKHRATMFEGVPTMFMRMLNLPSFDAYDLSSLRVCTVGGQTMPVTKMEEVERRFGCPLIELCRSALQRIFFHFDGRLLQWARRKYCNLRCNVRRRHRWWRQTLRRHPRLFTHWLAFGRIKVRMMGAV